VLRQGLSYAQMRAGSLPLPVMLEELSSGVRMPEIDNARRIYLAPSFWGAPFLFYERLDVDTMLVIFGSRPDNMALIPGDVVPDSLLLSLKALADPTRLRILRTLVQSPQTAAQLSRILRLRPPTVTHHLRELRLAGMVQVTFSSEGDRYYATRYEGFESTQELLRRFVPRGINLAEPQPLSGEEKSSVLKTYWARMAAFSPNAWKYLIGVMIYGAAMGVYQLLFNFYALSLGYNEAVLGNMVTARSATSLIVALPMGYIANKIGHKNAFILGYSGVGLAILVMLLFLRCLCLSS